jgi:hypothetical protein
MGSVIVGSPGTVVDRLLEVLKRFRIGNLHAMLQFGSMPRQLAMENIGLFAKEVIPKIRHVWQGEEKGEKWEHHWWPERLGGRPRDVASTTAAGRSAR